MINNDDILDFADEHTDHNPPLMLQPWKIMIVDDDKSIHDVTKLSLSNVKFDNRPLHFISCFSANEARKELENHDDIALILLDVVMEEDDSGLNLVRYIRKKLNNSHSRIVLRTGQPGQAPEKLIIVEYDINDYKEKTELSSTKLFTLVYASLRAYNDIKIIEASRLGLKHIIDASADFFRLSSLEHFSKGVLDQLSAFIQQNPAAIHVKKSPIQGLALEFKDNVWQIISGSGKFSQVSQNDLKNILPKFVLEKLDGLQKSTNYLLENGYLISSFEDRMGFKNALIFEGIDNLSALENDLINLFTKNISVCYENIHLNNELDETQREIIYLLGSAIEFRSNETGNHVKRVAEVSYYLAIQYGLSEREAMILKQASPLHDLGKIGIPDAILNKPGILDEAEQKLMRKHVDIGQALLSKSKREILQAAAIVAFEHHECWDGSGYPLAKRNNEIHIFGRITALADVTDALLSRRCYKEPWPVEHVLKYLDTERGKRFEPKLVDIFLKNFNHIQQILKQNAD